MSRSARTPLILVVLVSLLVMNYWQFFAIQKVSAQTLAPARPTSSTAKINFTAGRNTLVVQFCSNPNCTTVNYTYNFTNTEQITSDKLSTRFSSGAPSGRNVVNIFSIATDSGSNIYLAQGTVTNSADQATGYYFDGVFSKTGDKYGNLIAEDFTSISGADGSSPITSTLKTSQDPTNFINVLLSLKGAEVHQSSELLPKAVCDSLQSDWANFIGVIKDLIGQTPDKNSTDWKYTGISASQAGVANVASAVAVPIGIVFGTLFPSPSTITGGVAASQSIQNWKAAWDKYGNGWELTDAGKTQFQKAETLSESLAASADDIAGRSSGSWPADCAPRLINSDWTVSGTAGFKTPASFNTYIQSVMNLLKSIVAAWTQRTTTEDSCGSLTGSNLKMANLFNIVFCSMARFLHDSVGWGMTEARILLMSFVGVDITFSNVDTTTLGTDTSGTSPSASPTGDSGGTPSATDTTTHAVDIYANITYPNTTDGNNYINLIKAADQNKQKFWVKIAPLGDNNQWPDASKQISGTAVYSGTNGQIIMMRIYADTTPVAGYKTLGVVGGYIKDSNNYMKDFMIFVPVAQIHSNGYKQYDNKL